ncbi:MAG: sulfite exporter TauE/SafE family protein [bacterium]|nr:sulfite exporter TauE/SafE family protein [bacterium]
MALPLLLAVIFLSSLVLTMVGLGGGLIFSPLFVLLDFPVSQAVSASLLLNGIAAVSAASVYLSKRMVDMALAVPLIVTSVAGAPLGALMTSRVDVRLFTGLLAAVVFLAALRMIFGRKGADGRREIGRTHRIVGGGLIGLGIGFLGGMLGIGGGVFIVPLLIYVLGVPTKTAAASSIFIVCFSSFAGFATHAARADVDWRFLGLAAVCSFAGGQIGSRIMADRLRGRTVRLVFGVVLLAFCARLVSRIVA